MNLVLVGPAPPYRGGISQYTASLGKALADEHRVLLISFSRQYPAFLFPGTTQHEADRLDVEQPAAGGQGLTIEHRLDSISPANWARTAQRIVGAGPKSAIFQWWHPFFAPAYLGLTRRLRKRLPSCKILFLCHNIHPHERLPVPGGVFFENWLTGRVLRRADGLLVHSEKMAEEARRYNRRSPVRRIFHPRYDFYASWDAGEEPSSAKPRLLFFGKIREYKGLDVFIEALGKIGSRLDFEATVAGEFYVDDKPYRRQAERLNLGDRLVWEDRYIDNQDVPRLFRRADLVVLPYRRASQSGVIPLAYQFEVPVVASDVGGISEVVEDGRTGFLVPAGDADALADRIVSFFSANLKTEFQANIRAFGRNLSWRQVVDNILSLSNPPDLHGAKVI